ncbi:hypothetical protein GCM10022256_22790 [Frondihabitans peucedani]|uniref:Uncharacterized protein n=1 Tax=Frondihabitans peucedani TaxID=598626 RepID=A0ABP8E364_9MICO
MKSAYAGPVAEHNFTPSLQAAKHPAQHVASPGDADVAADPDPRSAVLEKPLKPEEVDLWSGRVLSHLLVLAFSPLDLFEPDRTGCADENTHSAVTY